jgi:hypothetical protein
MHVYMHNGDAIRFRCADYPQCRTFFKSEREAHFRTAMLLSLRPRPDAGQDPIVETPADEGEES